MNPSEIAQRIASVPNWYHTIELAPGIVTPGINDSPAVLAMLDLPLSMHGMRVLDVGARDGFFSFECERRGAEVVPIDYARAQDTGFPVAAEVLGSKLVWLQDNVYNVTPEKYGMFDLVLFLGVLYHLRDPLRAIDQLRAVCRGRMILETHVIDQALQREDGTGVPLGALHPSLRNIPIMQFYPGDSLCGDSTNYWGPNVCCVERMLEEANFTVRSTATYGHRALFHCDINTDDALSYQARIARGVV